MVLLWKSVLIRSRQLGGVAWTFMYPLPCCNTRRLLSPWRVNPIIFYRGNPSDFADGSAGYLRRRWRRVGSETSICNRCDAGWSWQRSAAYRPTGPACDAFHPTSRARTHARALTDLSHCIWGVSNTASGVERTYCTCAWACTCSISTSSDVPENADEREVGQRRRGGRRRARPPPCKRVQKQPPKLDWLEMFGSSILNMSFYWPHGQNHDFIFSSSWGR